MAWPDVLNPTESATPAPGTTGYDLNTPLLRLVEDAVGADINLVAPGNVQLGPVCQACQGTASGGTCSLVRRLAAGDLLLTREHPPVCDAGRAVYIRSLDAASARTLMILPRCQETLSPIDPQLAAIEALWQRCERLVGETEGLAQEVIRSYEQLNLIFDVTQEICNSQDPSQIKHFLIGRLAQTLTCDWSCSLSPGEGVLWWSAGSGRDRDQLVAEVRNRHADDLARVTQQRTCLVANCRHNGRQVSSYSHLFATLGEASSPPDVVVFSRDPGQPEFVYGDVMMIDSMLNHAQHVLSNLKLVERLRTMSLGAVRALVSAIDKKDHYTSGHSERVGFLAQLIGQHMGLSPQLLQDLQWGGLLHDVGKIGIHDGVLTKPGSLTQEEFDHIKQHVVMSHEIVSKIDSMASIRDIVLYHHEVPDGSGYPEGLQGEEIPLLARIVHVADTFDALTTSRSYRRAFPLVQALAILEKDKGTKLDADIVNHFRAAFSAFRAEQPDHYRQLFAHLEESRRENQSAP